MGKLNILIKFAKKAIVLALAFGAGFLFCLFKSNSSTDTKAIEVAVAEAVANSADELKEAKAELKEKNTELKKLKEKKVNTKVKTNSLDAAKKDMYQEVVETIFYDIPGDFVMKNKEFKFYSNRSCTPDALITNELNFITHRDVDGINESGFEVFISMSSQGPVYSTERPYFDPAN